MSPVWMQYEAASAHLPFEPHSPEQHCVFEEHVLFAVVQPDPDTMG
jgi:hypothetical protein